MKKLKLTLKGKKSHILYKDGTIGKLITVRRAPSHLMDMDPVEIPGEISENLYRESLKEGADRGAKIALEMISSQS